MVLHVRVSVSLANYARQHSYSITFKLAEYGTQDALQLIELDRLITLPIEKSSGLTQKTEILKYILRKIGYSLVGLCISKRRLIGPFV
jgi:type IV pilus biogenesis protein CpaD/CtpE